MSNYQIDGFNAIDTDNLSDYYEANISFQNHAVRLDITFDEYAIDHQKLEAVKNFVENLSSYHQKAIEAMQEDVLSGSMVKTYIKEHAELFAKHVEINISEEERTTKQIAGFYLKRVGFYPEDETPFAVFDYTIDAEATQYLVVANFKRDGSIETLTMES